MNKIYQFSRAILIQIQEFYSSSLYICSAGNRCARKSLQVWKCTTLKVIFPLLLYCVNVCRAYEKEIMVA